MVEADGVEHRQRTLEPLDPPGVAGCSHLIPVVQRVPPKLAGLGEIIGRNAGHLRGAAIGVEFKKVLIGPHVGAVVSHENRQVAEDGDSAIIRIFLQRRPLPEEQELDELLVFHLL